MNTINVNTINLSDKIIKKVFDGGGGNSGGDNTDANIFAPFIDDGKTRLYIQILQNEEREIAINYEQESANSLEIDWGDGSPVETSESTFKYLPHQYKDKGVYCITLSPLGNTTYSLGSTITQSSIFGYDHRNTLGMNSIIRADIGSQCVNIAYSFRSSLVRIVNFSPKIQLESIGKYAFYLTVCPYFIIPKTVKTFQQSCFYATSASSLRVIDCSALDSVPTLIDTYALPSMGYNKNNLQIVVPDNLYDEWIIKTNWSNFDSIIIKASEFNKN